MEAVRRYVFPLIWMVILAVIAAALAKMAFFSSSSADDGPGASPAAEVDQYATVAVARGDISSSIDLSATVTPDDGTPLKASDAGEISTLWVRNGDHVVEGDKILQVRVPREEDPVPAAAADPAGADAAAATSTAPAEVRYRYLTLKAGSDGTIRDLAVLKGQTLAIGDPVATISPGTYAIVADLTPEQQLRLLDQQITATAALPDAADPVPCQAPAIEEDDPSQDDASTASQPVMDPYTGEVSTPQESQAALRCPVPDGTKIVPGLSVTVTVDLGTASGVLTVPITAVEGDGTAGTVYVLDEETGEPTAQKVTLGKRSEDTVEVTEGVEEGTQVLQYVPGVDSDDPNMGVW
ncbi:hypothetical protein BRM3_03175 [Brachybacterium huguangmaarense]|uniref:Multidrug efflux pump subunit AcrA (Membrane-fusion protein) n=1 Tax=Brachybacterium huguangmaarense TaxID=1652028 RepID=A0ABY6G488_9MICO|nr:hypothetical protein [Brachybacterium huguangmaarense]UYG17446.1 hypothetical protein BRM3_03175 [Brachybacterium huguangmaarense]